MKKLFTLSAAFLMAILAFGKPVSMESARQVADNYYKHYSGITNVQVLNSFSKTYNGVTTYYVFNYSAGGFVVVSADDALIPVLAQSNTGFFEENISSPSVASWFEGYNKEISKAVADNFDNSANLPQWNQIRANDFPRSINDVGPLVATSWDQGCYYNAQCPVASGGDCGRAWVGCVATTMAQIAKYHSFPAQGYLSHSYVHPDFGQQSANFGTTTYNWAAMPNSVNTANANVATIMRQMGVSVDMDYGADGSGAFSDAVPLALVTYFNYDPSTISLDYRADYTDTDWLALLKTELDASRPMYYAGDNGTEGHAWVCDGYRTSDNKVHMNWGWSGAYNGYFAITNLTTPGFNPVQNNQIVRGIKPGNPNLVARITNINNNDQFIVDATIPIDVSVLTGTATNVKLYVDDSEIYSTASATFTYNWNSTGIPPGLHIMKVVATDGTNTVYYPVNFGITGWITQASGFTTASRGIKFIHVVDSLVVWATAFDGVDPQNTFIQEFTRTENGGDTWTPGIINNCAGLEPAMIYALNADTAYCPMFKQTGTKPQGIYVTRDGGLTWTRQTTATFSNSASFPNAVHFFNDNDGWCMGDPISSDFECYTTTDGGNTWTVVPGANLPAPVSGEFGVVGYYSAVGDNIWFGTNKGRVYRSTDKGYTWNVSATTLSGKYVDVEFATAMHGIAAEREQTSTGAMSETLDGGVTWQAITSTGPVFTSDYVYVPGTENTWVTTGSDYTTPAEGVSFSFDGGHSWTLFGGTDQTQYLSTDWANNSSGWAGGFSENSTTGGMYKFSGVLQPPVVVTLSAPENVQAVVTESDVYLSWTAPVSVPVVLGYKIYRNGELVNLIPVTDLFFTDAALQSGHYDYCVTAVYDLGESEQVCTSADITVSINVIAQGKVSIFPNPASGLLNVDSYKPFISVEMLNFAGQVVYSNAFAGHHMQIATSAFEPGMYLVRVKTVDGLTTRKISVK
jgi:hypothetical protein